ncbi:MAG: tRNA 2-selenouridine(34) synthase MnmH [Bdellovibrio sp.]
MNHLARSELAELFRRSTTLIDVRAPVEFAAGSLPGAVNLPLLIDDERRQVGTVYKEQGPQAAIDLGHWLVSGAIRGQRIKAWIEQIKKTPEAVIFCFRGGLRSQIVQRWLSEHGVDRPLIAGGYKAVRQVLLESLQTEASIRQFLVVSGPTGSGKTQYLRSQGRVYLDLEELASHRGSAFGAREVPQPTQVDFENRLAVQMLRLPQSQEPILIENESRMIGHRHIPEALFAKMRSSPKIVLHVDFETRVQNILQDYVFASSLGQRGDADRFDQFRQAVLAISKKLGGQRAEEIMQDLDFSQKQFVLGGGLESNRIWIRKLLMWYYDPVYNRVSR